jgi:hypothetical protein
MASSAKKSNPQNSNGRPIDLPITIVVPLLERCKSTANGQWSARCPAHDDRNPSLSVAVGDDDRVLVHCHAGCKTEDILAALNLKMRDLYPGNGRARGKPSKKQAPHAEAHANRDDGQEPQPEEWEPPSPLGQDYDRPEFPVDLLPASLGAWVWAEAEATQTPPDLAALLVIAVCGAGLARKVKVLIRDGWAEPVNLFAVVSLPPGDRKSAVFKDALAPVVEHERSLREEMANIIAEAEAEKRLLERQLKVAEERAARADGEERDKLKREAKDCARQLASHKVPPEPLLFCDDETPESLAKLLMEQGGRILQASAEGTAFEIAKGRYSDQGRANFDVYLKGHAGDPLRVGRVTRERDMADDPALSVALAVQPDVIRGLSEQASMKGCGFLARFLYGLPESRVGRRAIGARPVPSGVSTGFHGTMLALWRLTGAVDHKGQPAPHWLKFSPVADAALQHFERWLEPQLAPGEELSYLAGWGSKLAGAVARIAGVLHMAETLGQDEPWNVAIGESTVAAAIRIGRDYLLPHAKAAFGQMGADERLHDAQHVVRWLTRYFEDCEDCGRGVASVSKRDIYQAFKGRFKTVEELDPALKILLDAGYLRPEPRLKPTSAGRPASPRYEINPHLRTRAGKDSPRPQSSQSSKCREPGEEG